MSASHRSSDSALSSTSSGLLERVKARDPEAWERLTELYGPLVYSWCRTSGLSPEDSADVFQDVFAAVAAAIDGFRHDRGIGTFRGWLRTITRNKICDLFRIHHDPAPVGGSDAQRRLAEVPEALTDLSNMPTERRQVTTLLHRALELVRDGFQERTWQAFVRVTINGEKTADVAADLGLSMNAVRQYNSRILRRLREELGDAGENGSAPQGSQ